MIKNLILAFLVIVFAGVVTFGLDNYFKSARGDFFVLEKGQTVENFTFKDIRGTSYELNDFKDKHVITHFWASWCAPCVVEFPELVALSEKRRDDLVILAFSSDRSPQAIDRFLKVHKISTPDNFIIIHDEKQAITEDKFSVFRLPESFTLSPNLVLDSHIIGAYQGWNEMTTE